MRVGHCLLIVVVAIATTASLAFAEEEGISSAALERGANALQFAIDSDFKLSPFQGATVSYERFLRDRLSLRLGTQVSADTEDGTVALDLEGDTVGYGEFDMTNSHHAYAVDCQLVSYGAGRFALYYGGGLTVVYSDYRYEDGYIYEDGPGVIGTSKWTNRYRHRGVGISGLMGVQWTATHNLRFHAEYGTAALYTSDERTETRISTGAENRITERKEDLYGWEVTPKPVRLGMSVSF